MKVQILYAFTIQSQPWLDICVFSVARTGIRISLLDFSCAAPIDLRKHWLKWHAKNRPLRSAPAAPVSQWLGELEDLAGQFHLGKSINCRATALVANRCRAGVVLALQAIHDFAQKPGAAVNETGVKLNQRCARVKFFSRRFRVENSAGSDHGDCRSSSNFTHQCGRFVSEWRATQPAGLIQLRRYEGVIQCCVRSDDSRHAVRFTNSEDGFQLSA